MIKCVTVREDDNVDLFYFFASSSGTPLKKIYSFGAATTRKSKMGNHLAHKKQTELFHYHI